MQRVTETVLSPEPGQEPLASPAMPSAGRRVELGRLKGRLRAERAALLIIAAAYLAAALSLSLLTRAWEANDEIDHVRYIEYIVVHGSLPRISAANGHESHQPPLYYLVEAGWQKILGIPAFTPSAVPNPAFRTEPAGARFLYFLHDYSRIQRQDAIYLHELRALSVLFGLVTVLASYGSGRLLLGRGRAALAVAFTVVLWPKLLVVDSAVTNDSLVIALSALAVFVFLLSERARRQHRRRLRSWLLLAMGAIMGLAAITKYNSLPLAGLLFLLSALPVIRRPRLLVDCALAAAGSLAVSSWWFVHNKVLYGQLLATKATMAYLKAWIPALVDPVPWTNSKRFLHFVPSHLFGSVWYDGDWNEYQLPNWMNSALWVFAAVSVSVAVAKLVHRRTRKVLVPSASALAIWGAAGSMLAGFVALLAIAQTTTQAEGRIGFVGIVGFALLLVLGTDLRPRRGRVAAAMTFAWPVLLLGVDVYIFSYFVIPLRGLWDLGVPGRGVRPAPAPHRGRPLGDGLHDQHLLSHRDANARPPSRQRPRTEDPTGSTFVAT